MDGIIMKDSIFFPTILGFPGTYISEKQNCGFSVHGQTETEGEAYYHEIIGTLVN